MATQRPEVTGSQSLPMVPATRASPSVLAIKDPRTGQYVVLLWAWFCFEIAGQNAVVSNILA